MKKDTEKLLKKKKQDKKVMTCFSVVTGVLAVVFLIMGLLLDVNGIVAADGVLALFAMCIVFCVIGVIILCFIRREIRFIEDPDLKVAHDAKVKNRMQNGSTPTGYRTNPYTDEIEEDDGLSFEEIDHFESDIYDDM